MQQAGGTANPPARKLSFQPRRPLGVDLARGELRHVLGVRAAVAVWSATVASQRLGMAERVTRSGGRMLRALADLVAGR